MPLALQAKLLRVLEDHRIRRVGASNEVQVDVRVIASTNKDLQRLSSDGGFRADLYFRLSVLQIALPPLRNHMEDLPALCAALLEQINSRHQTRVTGIDPAALGALVSHEWPGNVRELRNVLERAAVLAREGEIAISNLPSGLGRASPERVMRQLGILPSVTLPVGITLERAEREIIEITLMHTRHNQRKAAEILGISAKTLYNKLRDYGAMVAEE